MKLAVIFLCLGITSLVDANKGYDVKLKKLDENQINYVARSVHGFCVKAENLKTWPESEIKARKQCFIEDVCLFLRTLSIDVGCTMNELLKMMNLAPDIIDLILAKNFEAVAQLIQIEALLKSTLYLTEGLVAQVGVLLKNLVLQLQNSLGLVTSTTSIIFSLHNSLTEVRNNLTGTFLGNSLGLVTGVLNGGLLSNGLLGDLGGGLLRG